MSSRALYTVPCRVAAQDGTFDAYGKANYKKSRPLMCAVIKMIGKSSKTSVRTDSSASRGAAREETADAVLLFNSTSVININDLVHVYGRTLRVIGVFPRYRVIGRIDHFQVECEIWE